MSTPGDKAKPNPTRNLNVQPEAAAKVKGGWFGVWLMPTTTSSTKPLESKIAGESTDTQHKSEIEYPK